MSIVNKLPFFEFTIYLNFFKLLKDIFDKFDNFTS